MLRVNACDRWNPHLPAHVLHQEFQARAIQVGTLAAIRQYHRGRMGRRLYCECSFPLLADLVKKSKYACASPHAVGQMQ
jgi:hypothetical protein